MITAAQMRAARALLGIDQQTLAGLADVSLPTIQRMEASQGNVRGVVDTLTKVVQAFDAAGVGLRFLEDDITTENGLARVVLAVLVAEAQAERRRLQERTSEGRVEAREKGVRFGRKPSVDRALVQELRRQGLGATDIARQMHIGRSTVYTILHSGQRDEPEDGP